MAFKTETQARAPAPRGRALGELVMADVLGSDAALICSGASVGEVTTLTGRLRKLLVTIEPSAGEPPARAGCEFIADLGEHHRRYGG